MQNPYLAEHLANTSSLRKSLRPEVIISKIKSEAKVFTRIEEIPIGTKIYLNQLLVAQKYQVMNILLQCIEALSKIEIM